MTSEQTPEQKAAEARAEKITFGIFGAIVLALVLGFVTMGLTGVGLVAVATVPVIYVLLVLMAGGKG
ncbi:hypothetical protein GCM10016455_20100 [Aliiroseovarius zhejiangensis]|uniref:Uncharacterized protein n=1 Tax=Aliiroseovarius zhejiangensis TaxID=1632025 RepID=A0ABQ3J3Q6_9RHOB|nr:MULTISPECIES: hypothetical protein [Aliiroseovarius]MCK8483024.1 hypothetical protein [Aliiroseovarius sp. S2029]GHE99336.1 hypothetical protein GCM10016455_20100 [Aliiroseovarius zhejiangensis]